MEEQRVPFDHPTIQAAVDASVSGGQVCVEAGVWPAFTVNNLGLTIDGAPGATIDAGGAPFAVTLSNTVGFELRGFGITGATRGGVMVQGGSVALDDLDIYGNTCDFNCNGVGFGVFTADLQLRNVSVQHGDRRVRQLRNRALERGRHRQPGGHRGQHVRPDRAYGGSAFRVTGGDLWLERSTIRGNQSTGPGYLVLMSDLSNQGFVLRNVLINGNSEGISASRSTRSSRPTAPSTGRAPCATPATRRSSTRT